jgi:hypothetical protein
LMSLKGLKKMSDSDNPTSIREALFRLLGLTDPDDDEPPSQTSTVEDVDVRSLHRKISDLTDQVRDLQGLTKMLAVNQAQLASDVYVIYTQVRETIGAEEDETASDRSLVDSPSNLWRAHTSGSSGTGGMIN